MSNVIKLFRGEPAITDSKQLTLRVYELLDGIVDKITEIDIKKCAKCENWEGYKIECQFCEDVYHIKCNNFKKKCTMCCVEFGLNDRYFSKFRIAKSNFLFS